MDRARAEKPNNAPYRMALGIAAAAAGLWLAVFVVDAWRTFDCFGQKGAAAIAPCKASLTNGWITSSTTIDVKKRLATILVEEKQYGESIPLLNDVVESTRASYFDYSNRGLSLYMTNQLTAAAKDFKQAYTMNSADDGYLADVVNTLIDLKDYDTALRYISDHAAANPNAINVQTLATSVHYRRGDYEAARASLAKALIKEKDNPDVHNFEALLLEQSEDPEKALTAYGKAIALGTADPVYLLNRALLFNDLVRLEEAEADFKAALAIRRNSKTLTGLANFYLDVGRNAEAKTLLDESLRFDETVAETNAAMGRYFVISGDETAATKYLDRTIALDPGHSLANYWRAVLDYNKGRFKEALLQQTQLLKEWPKSATLNLDIGDSLVALERYPEALTAYSTALDLNPSIRNGFESRARVHNAMENYDAAVSDANKAIAADGSSAIAYYRRAYSNWQLGNDVAARTDYDKAVDLAIDQPIIAQDRAEFLFFSGDIEESRKQLALLTAAGQTSVTLTRLKGRLAEYDGDDSQALINYEAALKEDPKNPWILEDVAWSQIANAQPATALETCNSMRAALPQAAEAHRCRAKALMRMSRDDEALQSLETALNIKPDFLAAALDKAYVQISLDKNEDAITTLGGLVRKKYRLATTEYYRGLAFENLNKQHLALKSYESALDQADPYLAKDISSQLNRLRSKLPLERLPNDLLYPQKTLRH
jgi:tetratricopeptide (TPR) repeat protein